jgi:hypothetical protein
VLLGLLLITGDLTELSSPEQGGVEPSRYIPSFSLHMMSAPSSHPPLLTMLPSLRCSKYLSGLAAMETEPELLPSTQELMEKLWTNQTAPLENPSYDLAALRRWLTAVDDAAQISAAGAAGDASPRKKSLTSSATAVATATAAPTASSQVLPHSAPDTSLLRHGHLFLCFDMAKRLLFSSCPALRSEAAKILKCSPLLSLL